MNPVFLTDEIRDLLLSRAQKSESGCWEYTGPRLKTGYGNLQFRHEGRMVSQRAHRLAFVFFKGAIPDGMNVCHSCDNRICFNPDHLWLGTAGDNMADMIAKGRSHRRRDFGKCANGHTTTRDDWKLRMVPEANGREYPHYTCRLCAKVRSREWWRRRRNALNGSGPTGGEISEAA